MWPRSMSASKAGLIGSTRDTIDAAHAAPAASNRAADVVVELPHRDAERRAAIRWTAAVGAVEPASASIARRPLGELHGEFIGRPSRSTCTVARRSRLASGDQLNERVVAVDTLAVHGDDDVVGTQPARAPGEPGVTSCTSAPSADARPSDRWRSGSTSRSVTPMYPRDTRPCRAAAGGSSLA